MKLKKTTEVLNVLNQLINRTLFTKSCFKPDAPEQVGLQTMLTAFQQTLIEIQSELPNDSISTRRSST